MKRRLSRSHLLSLLEDEYDDMLLMLLALSCVKRRKTHSKIFGNRDKEGVYRLFITKYLLTEDDKFMKYLRVTPYLFNRILENIRFLITTTPSNRVQNPISPQQKLCLALRFLATGESLTSLSFSFRISQPYISKILKEVFIAIKDTLLTEMPNPTKENFISIAEDFVRYWNFPNAIGCLDGKHVRIRCPNNTGSVYYNYKDFFSIVLLALVDAKYKFMAIDVGSYGREGDAGDSWFSFVHSHVLKVIFKPQEFFRNVIWEKRSETNYLIYLRQNFYRIQMYWHRTLC